jgi:hypothetical protein
VDDSICLARYNSWRCFSILLTHHAFSTTLRIANGTSWLRLMTYLGKPASLMSSSTFPLIAFKGKHTVSKGYPLRRFPWEDHCNSGNALVGYPVLCICVLDAIRLQGACLENPSLAMVLYLLGTMADFTRTPYTASMWMVPSGVPPFAGGWQSL